MYRTFLKILLIILSLLPDYSSVVNRIHSLGISASFAFYAILYSVLVLAFFSAALIRGNTLRWSLAALFATTAFVVDGYQFVSDQALTYDVFISLIGLSGDARNALDQHFHILILALIKSLILFIAIGLRPSPITILPHRISASFPIFMLVALPALLFFRGGEGAKSLPGAWIGSSYLALHLYEAGLASGENHARNITITRRPEKILHDIVLIVDESIAGHYLDINSPNGVRSGLGTPPEGVAVRNFGLAASISVCSLSSNLTLRYGGTRKAYQTINATMPSIWRYAKNAGMETIYIDAQRTGRQFINGMDETEVKDVDRWVQFEDVSILLRDHAVADALAEALNDTVAQFIYVNKMGAHFPVADKYIETFARYRPALPRTGAEGGVAEESFRDWLRKYKLNWQLYRNSYRNTLLWNVGEFFDRLFAKARIGGATIIYTSDHGQDLHEVENLGENSHCSADPPAAEAVVPLLVIESALNTSADWEPSLAANFNHSSHYRIFPTLLKRMGYDAEMVQKIYGEDLLSLTPDPYTFNARFNARLGLKPVWKKIDLNKLAMPPLSDYQVSNSVK